jgi:hypothetical protein
MRAGTEQPAIEGTGRFQVGCDERDVVPGRAAWMALGSCARVRLASAVWRADRQAIGSFGSVSRRCQVPATPVIDAAKTTSISATIGKLSKLRARWI